MSERHTDNQPLEPARRLTLARVGEILVAGAVVGASLTVSLLAAMQVAELLVAQFGQMVFENGILIIVVFGLIATLATRLLDWPGYSYRLGFVDLNQRISLPCRRAWTIGRWLLLPLILLFGLLALPKELSPATQTALQQQQASAAAAAANSQSRAVVAKQALAAQTVLTADNVELRVVPPDAMQPNVETDINDVIVKALLVPVANWPPTSPTRRRSTPRPSPVLSRPVSRFRLPPGNPESDER
jgi:hypothetical protein